MNDDRQEFDESRGPEWTRLVMWLTLTVGCLAVISVYLYVQLGGESSNGPSAPGIGDLAPLPPPEDSPIFEAVRDRAPPQFRENAAYADLLRRSRETSAEDLLAEARTDVLFPDLLARPERYRGLPIRLQGTAILVKPVEDVPPSFSASGRLFEAWVVTRDSQRFPYVLVFEDPPEGLPAGTGVRAFVVFQGYFFKLMAYQAGDKPRVAPMLIGQLSYHPEHGGEHDRPGGLGAPGSWLPAVIVGMLALYLIFRTTQQTRRLFAPAKSRRPTGSAPSQEISPEALADWLDHAPEEPDSKAEDESEDKKSGP
ncbi:hypothetical protein BH23PLA1_BH23PLA1_43920 [soil metagenome]